MKYSDVKLKDIPDFHGYKAGSDGNIYSFRSHGIVDYNKTPKKLKQHLQGNGKYHIVIIKHNDRGFITVNVHRLICSAYHGISPGKEYTVSHLDGNSHNNIYQNLKWETRSDNCHRKKQHQTDDIGIYNSRALFDLEQLLQIRKWINEGVTLREISKRIGCNERDIGKIKRGERYAGQGEIE